MSSVISVPVNFSASYSCDCGQTIRNSKQCTTVYATIAKPANNTECITFSPARDVILFNTSNVNTNAVSVYDSNGNALYGPSTSITGEQLGLLKANEEYIISLTNTVAIVANTVFCYLEIKSQTNVTDIFPNFTLQISPQPPSLLVTTDSFGNVTLSFTNYPLTVGRALVIANTGVAAGATNLIYTSSDTTVFSNATFGVSLGEALQIILVAKKTTSFTGTVLFSVTGSSIADYVNTLAIHI